MTTERIRRSCGRRSSSNFARAALAAVAAVACASTLLAADHAVPVTLSGLASQPFTERSVNVNEYGIGIRFRAPASRTLALAFTYWRRLDVACRVALHADAEGSPGPILAYANVSGEPGWVATPLSAALVEGASYYLVASCPDVRPGRLRYVLDADRVATAFGIWGIEDLRPARPRSRGEAAAPLFALVFDDGTWWGQPYRGTGAKRPIRICGDAQVRQTIVSRMPLTVTGIALARGADLGGKALEFSLVQADGTPVMSGALKRARPRSGRSRRRRPVLLPTAVAPATLAAGTPYVLTLRAPGNGACHRPRTLATELPLGTPLVGATASGLETSRDGGATWEPAERTESLAIELIAGSGAGGPATCGNGTLDDGEQCDGGADGSCPGQCTPACACAGPPRSYKSIYASGYMGAYDSATIPVWPKKLGLVLNGVDVQGPLIAKAKQVAQEAGNADARFIFYFSLTDMDSRCDCYDQRFYESFRDAHPEWILRSGGGSAISTNNGIGRLFATDIGNMAYIEAWADYALATADRYGFDGVFADNIFRGYFDTWSARPINGRTGKPYTTDEYRRDMLAALKYLRARFEAKGKLFIGNHVGSWDTPVFSDPVIQEEVKTMHGTEIEDCVYTFSGTPHPEEKWLAQLAYLDFANRHGTRTICNGYMGSIGKADRRTYMLASYLLTKEGFSSISELNKASWWWHELDIDLGAPLGRFTCLDPANGLAPAASCPSKGKIYQREWAKGRVLVNPTDSLTVTVPLGGTFRRNGGDVTSVTLRPHSGVVLERR